MKLTAEALAELIERSMSPDEGITVDYLRVAGLLLPRIERHVAGGQGAGDKPSRCMRCGWEGPFGVGHMCKPVGMSEHDAKFNNRYATPKPAGAVPIPEALPTPAFREDQPERFGYVRGWNACREAMIAYGYAREAAGRGGAVPEGWPREWRSALRVAFDALETEAVMRVEGGHDSDARQMRRAGNTISRMLSSPLPQQPANPWHLDNWLTRYRTQLERDYA